MYIEFIAFSEDNFYFSGISCTVIFVFGSVYVVNYVDRLAYVEPALHLWDEAHLIMMNTLLICCCIQFASILLQFCATFAQEN